MAEGGAGGASPAATIRTARESEAPLLTSIATAAKRHWGYPERWIEDWSAELTVTADRVRCQPTYVATIQERIVGFYSLSREGPTCELEHMWVLPAHMGHGIGKRLFEHAVSTCRTMGAGRLEIASDPNAEGFYLRMGARRCGQVPSSVPGRSLPRLELELG